MGLFVASLDSSGSSASSDPVSLLKGDELDELVGREDDFCPAATLLLFAGAFSGSSSLSSCSSRSTSESVVLLWI